MEDLFQLVEREGIYLTYVDLSGAPGRTVYGLYYRDPVRNLPVILLDHRVEASRPLHRSVLAEELGHHFTAPLTSVAVPYTSHTLQIELSRDEYRALKWACDYLMPVDRFIRAVLSGIRTVWELAEHFEVTEWLVMRRIEIMREEGLYVSSTRMVARCSGRLHASHVSTPSRLWRAGYAGEGDADGQRPGGPDAHDTGV